MRAGDTVRHRPSGETWSVAYVQGEYLAWNGWPPGEARVADCELVEACTDAEHRATLEQWAAHRNRRDERGFADRRALVCFDQLCEMNREYVGAGI